MVSVGYIVIPTNDHLIEWGEGDWDPCVFLLFLKFICLMCDKTVVPVG